MFVLVKMRVVCISLIFYSFIFPLIASYPDPLAHIFCLSQHL